MRENDLVYLFAALVPPREILDELWSVADYMPGPPARDLRQTGWRRARRGLRHREVATAGVDAPAPVLDRAPVAHVQLVIAKFGNLALNDANRLGEALGRSAAEWSSPRLRLSGYSSHVTDGDPSIWVDLEGDLDALHAVARGVHEVAKGLRLFVDRRIFQPRVRLGSVRPSATEAEVEALLAELDRFETNAWWQTGFGLFTPADQGPDEPSYRTYAEIPLGPHVVH